MWMKDMLNRIGIDSAKRARIVQGISGWSIRHALARDQREMILRLRNIAPDISNQESSEKELFNEYWELKRRSLQAFQCKMMLKAIEYYEGKKRLVVVDIGDSAGTHMLYLNELMRGKCEIDGIGVNLDPRAVSKIKARGQKALLCRAENLDLGEKEVDLFTSFQMVEHLHNPSIFFRRLAKKSSCKRMLITVPYRKRSRVGMYSVRNDYRDRISAEEEHIFELSPEDWSLLMRHSGWKVVFSRIYYQYPKKWPVISQLMSKCWEALDHEGFWGAILEKDTSISDKYADWDE